MRQADAPNTGDVEMKDESGLNNETTVETIVVLDIK